ncbi:hypothetical protein BP5796_01031 [Coleophoma crateriformis]|uniref:PARP catalytic domain-containing protein n=1 Tax=Coleophoma crateriformis TaxID=565419 RepID=A0A3D8TC89_9HELO|nr:hypothetical protein BP5796_01031 [Coleophoma crateriformis]
MSSSTFGQEASMSSSSSNRSVVKEGAKVEDMYCLRKDEIARRLSRAGILYKDSFLKHELQALWALASLGLIGMDGNPSVSFVDKVAAWCKMLVSEQLEVLTSRGLSNVGTKWDHVETLIRAELETAEAVLAKLELNASRASEEALPHYTVVNLLLATTFAETVRSGNTTLLPNCPFATAQALRNCLNRLQCFATAQALAQSMSLPESDIHGRLLHWLCAQFGQQIEPASGSFHITGMPRDVQQFVLTQPTAALQARFMNAKLGANGRSCVLYHGTPLSNLRSIISTGFIPAYDVSHGRGLFLAEDPSISYWYATMRPVMEEWRNTPFASFGAILGCEVSGNGRPISPHIHCVNVLSSVMVRYIFLVTPGRQMQLPGGSTLLEAMRAGISAINKRLG